MNTATSTNATPFVIERTYHAPVDAVWQALTDKDKMKEWYFDIAAFKAEVGFEFQFTANNKGLVYVHLCKVTEVNPGKKLSYSWTYKDAPGYSVVSFELFADGEKTRVKLTHTGLETFPQDGGDYARENFVTGWNHILGKSLGNYLEKTGK
jgi:uncharacterized protein YndB with AHSA1/START domain